MSTSLLSTILTTTLTAKNDILLLSQQMVDRIHRKFKNSLLKVATIQSTEKKVPVYLTTSATTTKTNLTRHLHELKKMTELVSNDHKKME